MAVKRNEGVVAIVVALIGALSGIAAAWITANRAAEPAAKKAAEPAAKSAVETQIARQEGRLSTVDTRLAKLEVTTDSVSSMSERLENLSKRIDQRPTVAAPAVIADNDCRVTDGLQLCWGKADLNPNGKHTRAFAFQFNRRFAGKPIIADSIKTNGSGYAFAIYHYDLTETTFTGSIVEMQYKSNNDPVEFSYIALGRPGG